MSLSVITTSFDYFNWIILPLLIFLSRLLDVTLGTLRHVFMAKGMKKIAPILGFFEVLLWLIVVGQVMKNLNNFMCYIGWAGGFAMGNYIGLLIEERIALGLQVIRIITNQNCDNLIEAFKKDNHGITIVDGQGAKGPVKLIFTIAERKTTELIIKLIKEYNPGAFYSVEDIKDSSRGVFAKSHKGGFSFLGRIFSPGK